MVLLPVPTNRHRPTLMTMLLLIPLPYLRDFPSVHPSLTLDSYPGSVQRRWAWFIENETTAQTKVDKVWGPKNDKGDGAIPLFI
ncbi:hypothetical protein GGU11DRAFT_749176 [Lentinula aff. detonsa]|nr:hypothetical protein GGU11DRAFT_749176 [Lentinula aff. detonsa]